MSLLAPVRRSRPLALLGVLLLLAAAALPAMVRMQCLKSGRTMVQWGHSADCCATAENRSGAAVKAECCEVTNTSNNIQSFRGGTSADLELPVAMVVAVQRTWVPPVLCEAPVPHRTAARPPPLMGRHLADIGRLLI